MRPATYYDRRKYVLHNDRDRNHRRDENADHEERKVRHQLLDLPASINAPSERMDETHSPTKMP